MGYHICCHISVLSEHWLLCCLPRGNASDVGQMPDNLSQILMRERPAAYSRVRNVTGLQAGEDSRQEAGSFKTTGTTAWRRTNNIQRSKRTGEQTEDLSS